jgi:ribose transport system ATP-binding protein
MNPLLSITGLSKQFPGVKALNNVDFTLQAGEVHALMGENGAGKSTLMKIVAGVYARDSGQILFEGRPVEVRSPKEAWHMGIGIIHQELNLMNHLSAAQNIFIGREPMSRFGLFIDEARLNEDAAAIFATMRLTLDPKVLVGKLTIAKQQMVEIAKALSFKSKILIMDEPTAALNNAEIEDLFAIIRRLKADGVGIIYISHKMDEIWRIADRVTVMRDGETIDTLTIAETDVATIIRLMVGRALSDSGRPEPGNGAGETVLEVRGLSRGAVVKDVGFTLKRGEILGFAGLMGAGRTEVARAIFGADPIDGGEIWVRGEKVRIRSPRDAVRLGIGYLSEDRKQFGLAVGMDVEANVVMAGLGAYLRGGFILDRAKSQAVTRDYISRLAIKTPSPAQPVNLLSGGNQQKIVIAKWLARDCDILFFDEPTRGIDVGAKSEIYKLLNALAAQGKAIVMISSELPEILRMSHRILVMCEGRVTGVLGAAEATQEKIMALATRRGLAA